jgi:outer membrane protein assembly factor BamB
MRDSKPRALRAPLLAGAFVLLLASSSAANDWPSFRGLRAAGVADGTNPPVQWDVGNGENVAWKTSISGMAHSSPIVLGDRVYLTTAISSQGETAFQFPLAGEMDRRTDLSAHQFRVLALDLKTGSVIWDQLALEAEPRVARHPHSSYAAATPATDGKYLVAFFGSEGLYAFDLVGKLLWKQDLGPLDQGAFDVPDYTWGYASSPVIYKNLVIVQCDQQKGSFIAAFDLGTGKEAWRTERDALPSWSTPGIYEGERGAELVTNGTEYIRGYDPLTGEELWRLKGASMISVPTPFVAHDLIYVATGYYRFVQPIYAIRPGARGDITLAEGRSSNASIVWSEPKGAPYLTTPLVYGDYFYTVAGNGVLTCYHARTGERVYQQRLGTGGYFSSSPVAADGRIYFANEDGQIFVVRAGSDFELLGTNEMGEVTMATPALAPGLIVYRTLGSLVAIGTTR